MWLAEAGVYYYKARVYHPVLGRFMQTDPIGYADGLNMYAYAGNEPINATDPTGLAVSTCPGGTCQQVEGNVEDTIVVNGTMPDWTPNINPDGFFGSGAGGNGGESGDGRGGEPPIVVTAERPKHPQTHPGAFILSQQGWCDNVGCGVIAFLGRRPSYGIHGLFVSEGSGGNQGEDEKDTNCESGSRPCLQSCGSQALADGGYV